MDTITMESLLITEDEWMANEGFFHRKKEVPLPNETPEEKREREALFSKLAQHIRTISRNLLTQLKHPIGYSLYTKQDRPYNDAWNRLSPSRNWWNFETIRFEIHPIAEKLKISDREASDPDVENNKWKTVGSISRDEMDRLYKEEIRKDPLLTSVRLTVTSDGDWDDGSVSVGFDYKKEVHHG